MDRNPSKQAIPLQSGASPGDHDHANLKGLTESATSHPNSSPEPTGSAKLTPIPAGVLTKVPMGVSGKRDHAQEYARRSFDYEFHDLPEASAALLNRLTTAKFISDKMLKVSWHPRSKATGFDSITRLEELMWTVVREYEMNSDSALRCVWVATAGKSGRGRAQARMVFQEHPNMILLKSLCRKIVGDCRVIGVYDSSEDWRSMSVEQKNNPPHEGCLHHLARHVEYPEHILCERNVLPDGDPSRAQEAPVCTKRDEQGKRRRCPEAQRRKDAKRRQRAREDAEWLAQNERLPC